MKTQTFLLVVMLVSFAVSCSSIDAEQANGGALYYLCDPEEEASCAAGYTCQDRLVHVEEAAAEESDASEEDVIDPIDAQDGLSHALCIPESYGQPEDGQGCGEFLEERQDHRCHFPFQCPPEGGDMVAGDYNRCPLGFYLDEGHESCLFYSCEVANAPPSVTIEELDSFGFCVDPQAGENPFKDGYAVRIYCGLEPDELYQGCPGGWTYTESLPSGCDGDDQDGYCFYDAATLAALAETRSYEIINDPERIPIAPVGSAMSCRPKL